MTAFDRKEDFDASVCDIAIIDIITKRDVLHSKKNLTNLANGTSNVD